MLKEVCTSCLQPVHSMDRVVSDKVCLHRSCFCCQVCRRKLSLQNYAALHGVFYCQLHYKQMAEAKSRRETGRLEHQPVDHQVQRVAIAGRGPQPRYWHNRAEKKTEAREKPASFEGQCSLQLAEQSRELSSRSVLLGKQLRTSWTPSETAFLAVDGKPGKGVYSWKQTALSLQTCQAAGSRVGRMMLSGQEGKSMAETAVKKGSFLPGVTCPEKREQACSWQKPGEQRGSKKKLVIMDGNISRGKPEGKVSERVAVFQQSKSQLKRGPVSASSPAVLRPLKSLAHSSFTFHADTLQNTKPTNWMYLASTGDSNISTAELPAKENEVCGTLSPLSVSREASIIPAVTDDKPELTIGTPAAAEDKHHLEDSRNNPQSTCVPGEPETRNTTNIMPKHGAEGVVPPDYEDEDEVSCLSGVSVTPYVACGSLEPGELRASAEAAELVNEKSKTDTSEFPGKLIPAALGENTQPSSGGHLPDVESKGAEFGKTKEMMPISVSGFLEEASPDHTSQENKPEKSRVSSPDLPEITDDDNTSCVQEAEPQAVYNPLINNPYGDISTHDGKPSAKDFPVSADMPLNATSTSWPSHDEASKLGDTKFGSKDPTNDLSRNTVHISEQSSKKLDTSKLNVSSDKSRVHPADKGKTDLKLPGESAVHTSRPGAQSKETRNSQARKEVLDKGFRLGKNPLAMLFGSEDKGSTPKKETTTERKPTKPQSAFVTLFGYSSGKKQSQQENPERSSEQTNIKDKQEEPRGPLSSSSQAKQKASKNNQLSLPGKMEVMSKETQEGSGGCSDSAGGKETNDLLLAPGASLPCTDKHGVTKLDIHDQPTLNWQVQQQQDNCSSLLPARENQKGASVTSEGRTNPLLPPSELMPTADTNKDLIRERNHHGAHLLEIQSLVSFNAQDTRLEAGIISSSSCLGESPKEAEFQLDNRELEDNTLLVSVENKRQDFPSIASKTSPHLDLQNSQTGTPPCFYANPSELCQEIPAETYAPSAPWDTSSISLLPGKEEIVTDPEGIQSCELLQQFGPQSQATMAAEDPFSFGFSAEGSTNQHLSTQESSFPPVSMFTIHVSETSNQDVFDLLNVDSAKMGQEAPAKIDRSRKTSGAEAAHESHSSADPDVLNDGLLDQEFFI
ncbi:uncharacterized protein LOC135327419 [Dromaius novaehollandiae]|uniref:uncharacterized protein LOC135327419 n=1 Tax=Dromaius novaehollandiae TaxID=8790 RepID=UPI00311E6BF1